MRWSRLLCAATAGIICAGVAQSQTTGQAVEDIDVVVHQGYTDINLLYACTLRYVNHQPSSEGDSIRIRTAPQRDCNLPPNGLTAPLLPNKSLGFVQALEVERPATTEIDIVVRLRKNERFLVLPTGDGRGLRIRVMSGDRDGRVIVGADVPTSAAYFAINLESSREPFAPNDVTRAGSVTGARAYVTEYLLEQEKWYRLRIGPFATETDAKRALLAARGSYPKAWLAIGDDDTLTAGKSEVSTPVVAPTQSRTATLTQQDIGRVLAQAKTAFRKKDYDTAIPILTKLLEQPEFPQRAEALELMGLARERNRQFAHAKAEYEEYLRRYPNGPAAERVQQRLHALALAARRSVRGLGGGAEEDESPWRIYGGFSQLYRRDDSSITAGTTTSDQVSQNALLNDFSFIARRRGERYDFASRVSAGFAYSFLEGFSNQTRVSTAFVELSDRIAQWRARLGRQVATGTGILGNFDGIYADYQWLPKMRIAMSGGSPVQSTLESFDSDRRVVSLSANFGPYLNAWDVSTYVLGQTFQGETDRRAVGTEVHYFRPGRTLVALFDYDVYFGDLNNALLLGTLALPARWTLSVNADRRTTPVLSLNNALIGQQSESLEDLLMTATREELDQLARDRTSISELYSLSFSRPAGEHWQWTFDVASIEIGGTPASGGVTAVPPAPRELVYSALAVGSGVFTNGDLNVLALRYQDSEAATTASLGISIRWPLWGAWRLTPRVRVDNREQHTLQTTQRLYVPSLRLEYQQRRIWLEFEGGTEIGDITDPAGIQSQKTERTFLSAGYRINF